MVHCSCPLLLVLAISRCPNREMWPLLSNSDSLYPLFLFLCVVLHFPVMGLAACASVFTYIPDTEGPLCLCEGVIEGVSDWGSEWLSEWVSESFRWGIVPPLKACRRFLKVQHHLSVNGCMPVHVHISLMLFCFEEEIDSVGQQCCAKWPFNLK